MIGIDIEREDRPAYVRFEQRPVEDKRASEKAGHVVCVDVEYALVTPPYSKDCVEQKVENWFSNLNRKLVNKRIPKEWVDHYKAQYKAWKAGLEEPVNGTPIKNWSAITPAQIKNLLESGCRTIEDLAEANDQALRSIGMGANELKRKARAYLQASKDHGPLVMENAALHAKNDQLEGTIKSLQDQIARIQADLNNMRTDRMDFKEFENDSSPATAISISDLMDDEPQTSDDMDLDTAKELYKLKHGKYPHPSMKPENLLKEVNK